MKRIHMAPAAVFAFAGIASSAQGNGPGEPQIAAIVVTGNQVDTDSGKLAKTTLS